jgi:hypothetical protein
MDYSHGVLRSMCSPFFPDLRAQLGPFLVDKTKLIENIVVTCQANGFGSIFFFDPDAAASRPCCKCSSEYMGLLPHHVLKLVVQIFFPYPPR